MNNDKKIKHITINIDSYRYNQLTMIANKQRMNITQATYYLIIDNLQELFDSWFAGDPVIKSIDKDIENNIFLKQGIER